MVDLLTLSNAIAENLPPWQGKGWTASKDDEYCRIKHPDGPWMTLHLHRYSGKEELNVSGAFSTAPGTENSFEAYCRRLNKTLTD